MSVLRSTSLFLTAGLLLLSFSGTARAEERDAIFTVVALSGGAVAACWPFAAAEEPKRTDGGDPRKQYARRGPFVGAAVSYAIETFESDVQSDARKVSNDLNYSLKDSFGFKGRLGYRCHRYVSAEVQVEWIDNFDGTLFQDGVGEVASIDFEPIIVTANGRGYLPLFEDRLQPFVLFGAGLATVKETAKDSLGSGQRASSRETEIAIRVGGGLDFYATPNVVLTLETDYLQAFGALDDFNYVSVGVGLQYRF